MAKSEMKFETLGNGVQVNVTGSLMTVRVDLDKSKATPSASGKMMLAGSTGGWKDIPGAEGWRGNVMVGCYKPR